MHMRPARGTQQNRRSIIVWALVGQCTSRPEETEATGPYPRHSGGRSAFDARGLSL